MSHSRRYRAIWRAANDFPAPCAECEELVTEWGGRTGECAIIHHVDGDWDNESSSNLQLMHKACHVHHHMIGVQKSAITRARMSHARLGPYPQLKVRNRCAECGGLYTPVWMTRHRNEGRCV